MRDIERRLAAKKAAWQPPAGMPQLTPSPDGPVGEIGNVDPNTRPANKGLKRFVVGPGGNWDDLKNPLWVAGQMAQAANQNYVEPLRGGADAFNPFLDQTPIERANKAAAGILTAADLATPFMPEGSILRGGSDAIIGEVGDTAAHMADRSPMIDLGSGLSVPNNPAGRAYQRKLDVMYKRLGIDPNEAVSSVGLSTGRAHKVVDSGVFDPLIGEGGLLHISHEGYAAERNALENVTGSPVYGFHRRPLDVETASGYRSGPAFDQGVLFNVAPDVPKTMTQGDSLNLWVRKKNEIPDPAERADLLFRPFDSSLPAPSPGKIGSTLKTTATDLGVEYDPYESYRELQMRPFDVSKDVTSAMLMRLPKASQDMIAAQRDLAEKLAAKGVPVVTGRVRPMEEILGGNMGVNSQNIPGVDYNWLNWNLGFEPDTMPSQYVRPPSMGDRPLGPVPPRLRNLFPTTPEAATTAAAAAAEPPVPMKFMRSVAQPPKADMVKYLEWKAELAAEKARKAKEYNRLRQTFKADDF